MLFSFFNIYIIVFRNFYLIYVGVNDDILVYLNLFVRVK